MKIFFNGNGIPGDSDSYSIISAHEKIGSLFSSGITVLQNGDSHERISSIIQQLGIGSSDVHAVKTMKELLLRLHDPDLEVRESENNGESGVYFIRKSQVDIAVFKVGRKRALMEILSRKLAHLLGLESKVVPGMFAALLNPHQGSDEERIEELWNGKEKIYIPDRENTFSFGNCFQEEETCSSDDLKSPHSNYDSPHKFSDEESSGSRSMSVSPLHSPFKSTPHQKEALSCEELSDESLSNNNSTLASPRQISPIKRNRVPDAAFVMKHVKRVLDFRQTVSAVVGIVQPFLGTQEKSSLYDFFTMTMVALAIGLRDAKKEEYCGSTFVDVEDSMPVRLDPSGLRETWGKSISATHLPYLDGEARTTENISRDEQLVLSELVKRWDIESIIQELQQQKIFFEDRKAEEMNRGERGFDEGECHVLIRSQMPHPINGNLDLSVADNPERVILHSEQLEACKTRLNRMKQCILTSAEQNTPLCVQDLVFAVDPQVELSYKSIDRHPDMPKSMELTLHSGGKFHIIGLKAPNEMSISLSKSAN